jgi:ferredoxin
MPVVKIVNLGKTIRVGHGANLRGALLTNGATPHKGFAKIANCQGNGACGTCVVEILRGDTNPPTIMEKLKATSQRDLGRALMALALIVLLAAFFAPLRGYNAWFGLLGALIGVAASVLLIHYRRAAKPLSVFGGDLWEPKRRLACQTKVYGDLEIDTLADPVMPKAEVAPSGETASARA